jgi:hypothetical protein
MDSNLWYTDQKSFFFMFYPTELLGNVIMIVMNMHYIADTHISSNGWKVSYDDGSFSRKDMGKYRPWQRWSKVRRRNDNPLSTDDIHREPYILFM